MKERPILFNTEMVRAILEGRKTQTRRIIKRQPAEGERYGKGTDHTGKEHWCLGSPTLVDIISCPYGHPGDRLWVRETWFSTRYDCNRLLSIGYTYHIRYKADGNYDPKKYCVGRSWKPSIHMPREASRILLEITSVRVERLNDISEEDAFNEGIDTEGSEYVKAEHYSLGGSQVQGGCPSVFAFTYLWESTYGAGSWSANPWVWVVEFKRVDHE